MQNEPKDDRIKITVPDDLLERINHHRGRIPLALWIVDVLQRKIDWLDKPKSYGQPTYRPQTVEANRPPTKRADYRSDLDTSSAQ